MNEKKYTVYMHISPSNKRYIGITSTSLKNRWHNGKGYYKSKYFYNAIQKYGWENFEHVVIVKGITKGEAEWLEIQLINRWESNNPDKGYNMTDGGNAFTGQLYGELNGMYGIRRYGEKNPNYGKGKKVRCIELNLTFNNSVEAVKYFKGKSKSSICNAISGRRRTAFGYHWEYVKQGGDEKI